MTHRISSPRAWQRNNRNSTDFRRAPVAGLVLLVFSAPLSAKCLSGPNVAPEYRYPEGDAWCAEQGDGRTFAYRDSCLRALTPLAPPAVGRFIQDQAKENLPELASDDEAGELRGFVEVDANRYLILWVHSVANSWGNRLSLLSASGSGYKVLEQTALDGIVDSVSPDDGGLLVRHRSYRADDSRCCPSQETTSRYVVEGGAIKLARAPSTGPESDPARRDMPPLETAFRALPLAERELVQRKLTENGNYSSTIDGLWGPGTARALDDHVRNRVNDFPVNNVSDAETVLDEIKRLFEPIRVSSSGAPLPADYLGRWVSSADRCSMEPDLVFERRDGAYVTSGYIFSSESMHVVRSGDGYRRDISGYTEGARTKVQMEIQLDQQGRLIVAGHPLFEGIAVLSRCPRPQSVVSVNRRVHHQGHRWESS